MMGESAARECCTALLRALRRGPLRTHTLAQLGPSGLNQLLQVPYPRCLHAGPGP